MEVLIRPDIEQAVDLFVKLVITRITEKPNATLGLATGRTMERVYAKLVASGVSFAGCHTFNLDEYIGLSPDDPNSYRTYMNRHLFDHVDIDPANTHVPNGSAADIKAAALEYEAAIVDAGGIELQLLGIGEAGHYRHLHRVGRRRVDPHDFGSVRPALPKRRALLHVPGAGWAGLPAREQHRAP